MTWRWLGLELLFAVHDRQIAEHGGADGIRDRNGLESAMARPLNLLAYGTPDTADLAAAYGFGLARNHGFVDGNKRTAWVITRVFLADSGVALRFDARDAIRTMEGLSAGAIDERAFAEWLRARRVAISRGD